MIPVKDLIILIDHYSKIGDLEETIEERLDCIEKQINYLIEKLEYLEIGIDEHVDTIMKTIDNYHYLQMIAIHNRKECKADIEENERDLPF